MQVVDHFEDQSLGLSFYPVSDDLVYKGFIRLPSGSMPYGSTVQLLAEIRAHLDRYVVFPSDMRPIIPHYVLYTWLYDRFETAPMLRFLGDWGNGKSRALLVVGNICYHPLFAPGTATMASLFRSLELMGGGTVVMDELDFSSRRDEHQDMMDMLRGGFQREGGGVLRADKTDSGYKPKVFDVFGPKVLAGRKPFPDPALESRCFRVYMSPLVDLEGIPRKLPVDHPYHQEAATLRNKLLRWRYNNYFKPIREIEQLRVEGRLVQLYEPLASVTDDAEALAQLQSCILALNDEMTQERGNSPPARVATALRKLSASGQTRVSLATVAVHADLPPGQEGNKEAGAICRSFELDVKRAGSGMVVIVQHAKLEHILTRYGLNTSDSEHGNNVGNVGNVAI
jgi:hypothetical protein